MSVGNRALFTAAMPTGGPRAYCCMRRPDKTELEFALGVHRKSAKAKGIKARRSLV